MNHIARIARRNAVLIVSFLVLGAAVATTAAITAPPTYTSTATLYVAVRSEGSSVSELTQARTYGSQVISSYIEVATTDLVLQAALDDLGVDLTPDDARRNVHASAVADSLTLELTASGSEPTQVAALANAVAASFSTVVEDRLEARDEETTTNVHVLTVQPALVPTEPSSPNPPLWVALGALVGAAMGLAAAVARTALDRRPHTADEMQAVIDAPRLGEIVASSEAARFPAIVAARPHSMAAEAFRSLRTNVSFLTTTPGSAAFVVTSAIPGEGKSTVAANLAATVAETGARVALVDADLRKPVVATRFGIEGGVGLSDVLVGRVALSDAVQSWGVSPLFVLPAGVLPPNPAELLGSEAMTHVIDQLRAVFDLIVFDAPPLLPVTDAVVLTRKATGAFLVVRAEHAHTDQVVDAVAALATADALLLGFIANSVPAKGADAVASASSGYADAQAKARGR